MILSKSITVILYTTFIFFIIFFSALLFILNVNINFYSFLCGLGAFSSIFLVLERVAKSITKSDRDIFPRKPSFFKIVMGFLLKFILPVCLIWIGVVYFKSTPSVFVGALTGLVCSTSTLYVLHWLEVRDKIHK